MKYLIVVLLFPIGVMAQVRPFFGGGLGYLNNAAIEMKAGVMVDNVMLEAATAFSAVVPFQHSLKLGYNFGETWYAIPSAGAAFYTFAQEDKERNYTKFAVGIEAGRRIDLWGTYGGDVFSSADVYISVFGKWKGIGFKMQF